MIYDHAEGVIWKDEKGGEIAALLYDPETREYFDEEFAEKTGPYMAMAPELIEAIRGFEMDETAICISVSVGPRFRKCGGDSVSREITFMCDDPSTLKFLAASVGSSVNRAVYSIVCEYLENLKGAEAEKSEATNE